MCKMTVLLGNVMNFFVFIGKSYLNYDLSGENINIMGCAIEAVCLRKGSVVSEPGCAEEKTIMKRLAHAKVNIGLIVGKRRPDGYHDLETYMARIGMADLLELEIVPSDSLSITLEGNDYLQGGEDLMEKAARAFSAWWGINFSLSVRIEKRIPLEAGLGGGSSDAACVLEALSSFFSKPLPVELCAAVGSDVPFLASGAVCARVTGRGEVVEPCDGFSGETVYVLVPRSGVNTAAAFKALDSIARPLRHLPALGSCVPEREVYPNDFELVYTGERPEGLLRGPDYCSLTGSGSGWFIITRFLNECLFTSADYVLHQTEFM